MNIEDTFRSYVDNSMSGTGSVRSLRHRRRFRCPCCRQSPGAVDRTKVWAWVKKWLGFVIFLIIDRPDRILWWKRRCGRSKRPPDAASTAPPNCPHAGNLQVSIRSSPNRRKSSAQVPESELRPRRAGRGGKQSRGKAGRGGRTTTKWPTSFKRRRVKIPERTLPNKQQAPKVDDEDFDTLANPQCLSAKKKTPPQQLFFGAQLTALHPDRHHDAVRQRANVLMPLIQALHQVRRRAPAGRHTTVCIAVRRCVTPPRASVSG